MRGGGREAVAIGPVRKRCETGHGGAWHGGGGRVQQFGKSAGKSESSQIGALRDAGFRIDCGHNPVAHVQHECGAQDAHIVERSALIGLVEDLLRGRNAQQVFRDGVAEVINSGEDAVILAELVVEARQMRVIALNSNVRKVIIILAVDGACLVRQRIVASQAQAGRAQQTLRQHIAGERRSLVAAARDGYSRERVVNLIAGTQRQQRGEIAGPFGRGGHGAGLVGGGRLAIPVLFPRIKPETAVSAIIDARDQDRAAHTCPVAVILVDRLLQSGLVIEKIRGIEGAVASPVISLAVNSVAAALRADVDDGTKNVTHRGVIGVRLEFKILHGAGGRNKRHARITLAAIICGVVDAVDVVLRLVVAAAVDGHAGGAVRRREFHDADRRGVGHAGAQPLQFQRIAAALRQLGQATCVDHIADGAIGRVEQWRRTLDIDRVGDVAHLQPDRHIERIGHVEFESGLGISLEAVHLDSEPIKPRQKKRQAEITRFIRYRGCGHAGLLVRGADSRGDNRSFLRIENPAGNGAAGILCGYKSGGASHQSRQTERTF